jgi:hypothetical protein
MYNRQAAVKYAYKWYNKKNKKYYSYTRNDCANFVSQCLYAGGIKMNSKWHSYRKKKKNWGVNPRSWFDYRFRWKWDVASAWRLAEKQFNYFKNPTYNISSVVTITKSDLKEKAKKSAIQVGDLMYFAGESGTDIHHATIITKIDKKAGKIFYSAHTAAQKNKNVAEKIKNEKLKVIRIKSTAK